MSDHLPYSLSVADKPNDVSGFEDQGSFRVKHTDAVAFYAHNLHLAVGIFT